jgi:soluble lytic murein transglycosylase
VRDALLIWEQLRRELPARIAWEYRISAAVSKRVLITIALLLCFCAPCVVQGAQTAASKSKRTTTQKKTSKQSKSKKKPRKVVSRRVARVHRAFVASANLKPMARQLLQDRTRAAYAGVEAYARKHARDDAGVLARLALGYAHVLDQDYAKAIEPLRQARANAGDLGDYIDYFLATSYSGLGQSAEVVETLRGYDEKYPDSLFARDVVVLYANALIATGEAQAAIALLEKHRHPPRAEVDLALGRAYAKAGDSTRAADALRRVYFSMPLSTEAEQAKTELDALSVTASLPPPSFSERKMRADVLSQRRPSDAANEYRELMGSAPPEEVASVQVAYAAALQRSGRRKEARDSLEKMPELTGDAQARRLYLLAEIARSDEDEERFTSLITKLRDAGNSSWLEDALLSGGNMYLLKRDYDKAIDYYRELHLRFPAGRRGSYAHWKAAWLSWRQGRSDEAKREFDDQIATYPTSPEVSAALYWRARLAEEERDIRKAAAYYRRLSEQFHNYYYAELARARLRSMHIAGEDASDPLLDKVMPAKLPAEFVAEAPDDNLRVQKSMLLQNGGLYELAVRELQAAAVDLNAGWATAEIARIYQENGQYHRALQVLKRAVPTYYSLEIESLPRNYWESLFPRPFWGDLKKFASRNKLDAFVVASLIRQESEFNPGAVSRADALGLMQLLPSTGKKVAREVRIRRFSTNQLLLPTTNLQLGTRYFRTLVDHFNGQLEYALAAYNAGPDRVESWLSQGGFRDTPEFVESIPFTETREYVQAIVRNTTVYRKLYGTP